MSILHVILAITETSAPYNEHCLPWADHRDITICTYFESKLTPPKTITLFEGKGSLTSFYRSLKAALNEKEYDVIHVHSPHLGLLFLLVALFTHRKANSSSVITVHDSYQNYKLRNRIMFLPVFASFRSVVFCSRASYESFPVVYKRLAGDRFDIVQNGVDLGRVDRIIANINGRPHKMSDFTIITIGRLVDVKNPFVVLAAYRQCADRNSHLTLIGDGPLRHSLAERITQESLESQVELTGLIPRENVFEYLLNADLYISSSRGEGLPVAVLEAMACGCPVLLSDIPPHREIAEGVDFIPLIKPDDSIGFAREIKKFRDIPIAERKMIGRKCRDLVVERFSLTAMHNRYEEVYARIIGSESLPLLGT